MATARRIKRLQQVILQAAASHVQQELGDPRVGVVSITRVKLSPDLSHGQLFWSSLGDEAQLRTTERGLEDSLGSIQRAVAGALQTRTTPRLELVHDTGMVHAQRLEEIFTQLRDERGEDEPSEAVPTEAVPTEAVPTEAVPTEDVNDVDAVGEGQEAPPTADDKPTES